MKYYKNHKNEDRFRCLLFIGYATKIVDFFWSILTMEESNTKRPHSLWAMNKAEEKENGDETETSRFSISANIIDFAKWLN